MPGLRASNIAYGWTTNCDGNLGVGLSRCIALVTIDTRMQMSTVDVLLVANRTSSDRPLVDAVRCRAGQGPVRFHLVVPAAPRGLHRVVDPEVSGVEAAKERLRAALPVLSDAAGQPVTGSVGDANPLAAVQDALNLQGFDEIILSTLPWRVSRWMRLDLPSKIRALGKPVLHVGGTLENEVRSDLVHRGATEVALRAARASGGVGGPEPALINKTRAGSA
jgi:hypothetical protein